MNKLIRLTLNTFIITILVFMTANSTSFANSTKYRTISIPTFKVQIQDMSVDSSYMQYPLIIYNDITYFPLTWNWCHKMSLSTGYTEKDGLYITKHYMDREDPEKMDNGGYQPAGKKYTATVVDYPVVINGKKIDNQKEQYPLLNFRGVTYFPLTWRFVVDEFNWNTTWDDVKGLKVTTWREKERKEGTTHQDVSYYLTGDYVDGNNIPSLYYDYAIIKKSTTTYTITNKYPNGDEEYENDDWSDNRTEELYKLNYADDSFTKINSKKTSDKRYNSGKAIGKNVSDFFVKDGTKVMMSGKLLYDVANDAGAKNTISKIFADKYEVNGLSVYLLNIYTTQEGKEVPAPYTPHYRYAFVDKGDGIMHRIKQWNTQTSFSGVYNNGKGGFYLCSYLIPSATTHYHMERARVYNIDKNLKVDILNDKWKDWKSTEAIGADKDHNLYLINTWYSKQNEDPDHNLYASHNLLSPINDGYYKLSPDGELTKIYPYVQLHEQFVTPDGEIYASSYDFEDKGFFHIQQSKWIKP